MYKKVCSGCKKTSYSLSAEGRWFCPGCGANMTNQPIVIQGSSTANILPVSSPKPEGYDLN